MFYSPEALLLLHHHDQARLYEQMLGQPRRARPGLMRRAWSAVRAKVEARRPARPVDCVAPCAA